MQSTFQRFFIRVRLLTRALRWMPGLALWGPNSRRTAADLIEQRATRHPDRTFVKFEGQTRSYGEYNAKANRVAHWALERGIGKGEVVALMMENRPEYLEVWAGLAKTGATTALLNTQLSGPALAHVLEASECKTLLLGAECVEAWATAGFARPAAVDVFVVGDPGRPEEEPPPTATSFDESVEGYSDKNPPGSVRADLRGSDPLFYIYTSGTTGLPKAARFSHARFMGGGIFSLLSGMDRRDTLYCTLPLYHTVGGVMCVNAVLRAGATLALQRHFSARSFWRDVVEMEATAFQYVGELCRYLVAAPETEWETRHRIRFCVGNGLRPDVWERFQERFGIPHITEFYGATESNVSMVNLEDQMGSVGRPTPGTRVALIRYDVAEERHPRDDRQRCVVCPPGEPGELIGEIREGRTAAGRFEGYTSKKASEKKILRDVFTPGDRWFRTGDLLRRDARGFYYFVDRLGDTFRWKGENVSTQEVAEALQRLPEIELCAVYGVPVPDCDGRAGMAALVMRDGRDAGLDGRKLHAHVSEALPGYARPAFVRLQPEASLTGTFKLRKVELQAQGFDLEQVQCPLYYRDDGACAYLPVSPEVIAALQSGALQL